MVFPRTATSTAIFDRATPAGTPDQPAGRHPTAVPVPRRNRNRSVPGGGQFTGVNGSDFPAPPPGMAMEEKWDTTRSSTGSSAGVWCTANRL